MALTRHEALAEVRARAEEYHLVKDQADAARSRLDSAVFVAKGLDATFRELTHFTGHSIGFIQKSLIRCGYTPRSRAPREEPEAVD